MLQAEIHISPENQDSPLPFRLKEAKKTKVADKNPYRPGDKPRLRFFHLSFSFFNVAC